MTKTAPTSKSRLGASSTSSKPWAIQKKKSTKPKEASEQQAIPLSEPPQPVQAATNVDLSSSSPSLPSTDKTLQPRHIPAFKPISYDPNASQPLVYYNLQQAAFVPIASQTDAATQDTSLPSDALLSALKEDVTTGNIHGAAAPTEASFHNQRPKPCLLKNAISFIDRGSQTMHFGSKEQGTNPQVHGSCEMAGSCSIADMYDAHHGQQGAVPTSRQASTGSGVQHALRVVERMIYQNINSDIATDFKYWDDPADEARPDEGTLLPLWTFHPQSTKDRSVTAIVWHPTYKDVFASGHGSFDPGIPLSGLLCIHSLSDANKPERMLKLSSGVISLDWHAQVPCLLVVGCQDGSIHVVDCSERGFDIHQSNTTYVGGDKRGENHQGAISIRASSAIADRHGDAVWQVRWVATNPGAPLRLYSTSSDGKFVRWEMTKSRELRRMDVLDFVAGQVAAIASPTAETNSPSPPNTSQTHSSICCFDIHPTQPSLVAFGTQEGGVLHCSLDAQSTGAGDASLTLLQGHNGPVYTVMWSNIHSSALLSASADWTVRIWESSRFVTSAVSGSSPTAPYHPSSEQCTHPTSLLDFDLGCPVGDATWAPYSSTVFAAATEKGKVFVYDLSHSRETPLCVQKIVQPRVQLTKLVFHKQYPILLVGTDGGAVIALKLSPNLRKFPTAVNTAGNNVASKGNKKKKKEKEQQVEQRAALSEQDRGVQLLAAETRRLQSVLDTAKACKAAEMEWVMAEKAEQGKHVVQQGEQIKHHS